MAKTGKTSIPITPAKYRRARVGTAPENSVQTGQKGQPLQISGGYVTAVTGHVSSIAGFYRNSPGNGASDGAKTASFYIAENGLPFRAAYSGTLSESVRGLRVNLSVNSAGAPYLIYNAASSTVGAFIVQGWDTTAWQAGDVNPEVIAVIRDGSVANDL